MMARTGSFRTTVLGLVALAAAAVPVTAQPGGYYLYEYTYYSDASHTEVVGITTEQCDDYAITSGVTTPYYTRVRSGYFSYSQGCTMY